MTSEERWLLPEAIDEVLPPLTWQLEQLRRQLLDLYRSWGYELVMPPFVEHLESLLVGTGNDLDMQTFKLIDPLSGRLLGVRADMTPQVARIDAHRLQQSKPDVPTRLCYIGTVLRTSSDDFASSRSPVQVGAELYGHAGVESDLEVLILMLETLHATGIDEIYLDLGHVAIFRALVQRAGLTAEQEAQLFAILQRKALPELQQVLNSYQLSTVLQAQFLTLPKLNGDREIISQAWQLFDQADVENQEIHAALTVLSYLADCLQQRFPELVIHFDLAELRGYRYHTGVVFSAYVPGQGQEIARGGRYDKVGQAFGRARPATGFSTDLKRLLLLSEPPADSSKQAIFAPAQQSVTLDLCIDELRASGERVIKALPDSSQAPADLRCDRLLVQHHDTWVVEPLPQ